MRVLVTASPGTTPPVISTVAWSVCPTSVISNLGLLAGGALWVIGSIAPVPHQRLPAPRRVKPSPVRRTELEGMYGKSQNT